MVRWVAFDDDTAEAVVSRLRRGAAEIQNNAPLDAALHSEGTSVLVLPSPTPGKLLIARFAARRDAQLSQPSEASATRSLPIGPKKPVEATRKPWWRKLVA